MVRPGDEMGSIRAKIMAWDRKYEGEHPRWRGPAVHELNLPDGGRVLELGCGDGKTLRGLVGKGHEVVALDFSRQAILSMMARMANEGHVHPVLGDGSVLPFSSETFQLVVGHHFFEHLESQGRRSAAREVARVLSPGGILSVRAFGRHDMRDGKGEVIEPSTYLREGIVYHYFEEEEIVLLFGDLKLCSLRTEVMNKRFAGEPRSRVVIRAEFHKGL
jgi:ubiquinone/menaquinone biosynthesis C-methylase UbiE